MVTIVITGSGFSIYQTMLCSAKQGYDPIATTINDTMVICPLRRNSVATGNLLYVWDASQPQAATIVRSAATISQDNTILPVIDRAYVVVDGIRTNYISRCTSNVQQLVIEGIEINQSFH